MRDREDIGCRCRVVGDGAGDGTGIHTFDFDLISEIGMIRDIGIACFLVEFSGFFTHPYTDDTVILDLSLAIFFAAAGEDCHSHCKGQYDR